MIDYHRELIKRYHPDLNKGDRTCAIITKVINKLKRENKQKELKNLYERLYVGFRSSK